MRMQPVLALSITYSRIKTAQVSQHLGQLKTLHSYLRSRWAGVRKERWLCRRENSSRVRGKFDAMLGRHE